uniref:Baculoviral IAP repeat-containing protein n=1 Tax=Litopenaeus vannamei majanivirus Nimav-1_LVa TaxID=2984273 RepID=A0A9C7BH48_9VIRU|nr:MAG: baculoviral IAP repeat-containing protein [Litopenaeus vannamei majanivirus Nimav-1_LVa]
MSLPFITTLPSSFLNTEREKFNVLRFERARLNTFNDWPVEWINPSELAADGFYYLEKDDYCACIFCRGIIGKWEKDDTPKREHRRHYPRCSFVTGQPIGNIPIKQGDIITDLTSRNKPIMSYEQFNSLKELDIVKHVLDFKFNPNTIMTVLNDHLHKNDLSNMNTMKYTYILYLIEIMQNQQHDSVEIEPLSNIHYSSCDDSESDDSDSTVSESDSIRSVEMLSDLEIKPLSNIHYSSCDDSESDDSDSTVSESDSIRSVEMSDLEIKPLSNIHYSSCDDSESDDSESNSIRTVEMLSDLDEENIVEMDAGYPVSIHDLSNRDNLKSSYGDDGVLLTHASEEALCLTLYCALGLLIEKGITVKLNKSNAEYLVNFPAVKIEVVPNREGNTIIRGKINKSDGRRTPDEDRINANDIHNGGKEYSYPIKIPYSNSELSESIIIESKGRGLKVIEKNVIVNISRFNKDGSDNQFFIKKKKVYSVNNIMKLASCTAENDDDYQINEMLNINAISVLIYGICEGWSKSIVDIIEEEIIKKCFHLKTAAGMAIYNYLTQRNVKFKVVKEAAKTLFCKEKYLRYSKKIDNDSRNTKKIHNSGIFYINKNDKTSCALLLCKSVSKESHSEKNTKSKIFNLLRLFGAIDTVDTKFIKCLGVVYDSIDMDYLLPNQKSKSLDYYLNNSNNITSFYSSCINKKKIIDSNDNDGIIDVISNCIRDSVKEPIYCDINEEHLYLDMNNTYVPPDATHVIYRQREKKDSETQTDHILVAYCCDQFMWDKEEEKSKHIPPPPPPPTNYDVPKNTRSVYTISCVNNRTSNYDVPKNIRSIYAVQEPMVMNSYDPNQNCNTLPLRRRNDKNYNKTKKLSSAISSSLVSLYDISPSSLLPNSLLIRCHTCQQKHYNI